MKMPENKNNCKKDLMQIHATKLGELLGTPNVKPRAISSQAPIRGRFNDYFGLCLKLNQKGSRC